MGQFFEKLELPQLIQYDSIWSSQFEEPYKY